MKKSHDAVDYGKGNAAEHCGVGNFTAQNMCRHYTMENDPAPLRSRHPACELVKDPISPNGWCKLWKQEIS